jgi:hypothetical protein
LPEGNRWATRYNRQPVCFSGSLYVVFFNIYAFESVANQDGSYGFVSPLRVGYGIDWLALCLIIYRTKISDWLKASILAGSLTTFMVGKGVQFNKTPIVVGLVILLVAAIGVFLLLKMKKKWYHYFAIIISKIASLFFTCKINIR